MTCMESIIPRVKLNLISNLKSSLCGGYILVSGTIPFPNTGTVANPNNRKHFIIKNFTWFTDCIN